MLQRGHRRHSLQRLVEVSNGKLVSRRKITKKCGWLKACYYRLDTVTSSWDQKGGTVVTGLAMMLFHFLTRPWVKGALIATVVMLVVWKLLTADG
jgi:hypothetical protein